MAELYIKGWLIKDDEGAPAAVEDKEASYFLAYSIPKEIESFAYEHGRVRDVNKGLGGKRAMIFDANLHIYFTEKESTLEEAQESLIFQMYGDVETDMRLTGYSEYTITGYDLEDFSIGGHDLEAELSSHMGEYIHFVLEV